MEYRKFSETAATTGRSRRAGWLDLEVIRTASTLCGITELCLTKLDVLSGLKKIRIGRGYKHGNDPVGYPDLDTVSLGIAEVLYEEADGWAEDISQIRDFNDLPESARKYVRRIETAAERPVRWIGVGPERESIIHITP